MQFNLSTFGLKVDVKRMLVHFSSHLNACLKIEEFASLSLSLSLSLAHTNLQNVKSTAFAIQILKIFFSPKVV